jgi:modulator of FtsH protease HflC
MSKHLGVIALGILVVGSLLTYTITYQVDELRDIVLIERFGKVTRSLHGKDDAGLHVKWPWPVEKVIRYDSRAQIFEDVASEVSTVDKQNVLVTTFCVWRVAEPAKYHTVYRTDDSIEKAERIRDALRRTLASEESHVVGRHEMAEFVNTDPGRMQLEQIEQEILGPLRKTALRDYGVEIVRVGIKSLALPEKVTEAVIAAMKEERQRDVKRYESGGEAEAKAIEERAKSARDQILAFADRKAKAIRTEGDRAAAKYYERFREDPQFSMFLRSLESLRKELADKAVILLDGSELPAVKWLREGPSLPEPPASGQTRDSGQGN